ncbi:hypothetical protein P4O66_001872 [Electrophorus voltai]|uniref:Uncharacterized protein n=1 Tax=Electrophorus voltai TaxID=2609070 RepID=A0AAD9DTF6_9TELE|nr:hypothetical protein P4O66_001872 [Electrophorus voltai]
MAGNFLDAGLANQLALPLVPLDEPQPIAAIDGQAFEPRVVSHQTRPVTLWVLQLLLKKHLFIKLEKSTFHAQTLSFLGFVISHKLDLIKVRYELNEVKNGSSPTDALTKKVSGQFCWSIKAQQTFEAVFSSLTWSFHLSLRYTYLRWVMVLFCPSDQERTRNCIPVPTSFGVMTWVTVNYWRLSSPSRSGGTGWGSKTPLPGLDRPQELGVHTAGQAT